MSLPLKTTSLPEAVYDALRESIVTVQEAPGSLLTETAIALRYGVARPTAKAALERLVSEGLLDRRAHHAAKVPQLSRDDIADLYSSRVIIEEAALRNLAGTGTVPARALAVHRELLDYARADEAAPFARVDVTFHRELVLGQPSLRLARMHALIMGEIELCIGQVQSHRLLNATEVARQHQGILDAVQLGDVELAGRLTREHIEGARDRLLKHVDQEAQ
ncbi:MAG: transcriptional regulator, GntR family protein [Microbacteriaceae bacterium]|jgi:DNA-binding GntR family transcriptional regulator|nr:transcriptional regulator, GntR family protein [Microbacteriaceae bacterium]